MGRLRPPVLGHVHDLPAGSFDANLTFAQALTESARSRPRRPRRRQLALLRYRDRRRRRQGGPRTPQEHLQPPGVRLAPRQRRGRLRDRPPPPLPAPHRPEALRRPRRRGPKFNDLYRTQAQEFPPDCREADYERRLTAAYPIHPELFDRLYTDWSSLDKFQRTRGVLRLMAAVIHALWERQDSSLMILPANVPIDEPPVQFELTRYMEDPWVPVIEKDVDGSTSLPLRLDRENPNLGRYSACRRVARTLYLGSAPTLHTAHKGIEDRRVKLGCVQPGESVATFGDALRRLTDSATHLYVDGNRYWFSTQPSVLRTAQERAERLDEDVVHEELRTRLRKEAASRGDFDRVHACPASGTDIPDARETRLVILGPDTTHTARSADTPARKAAEALLTQRGTIPRLYRNTLVFLAPDKTRLAELDSPSASTSPGSRSRTTARR